MQGEDPCLVVVVDVCSEFQEVAGDLLAPALHRQEQRRVQINILDSKQLKWDIKKSEKQPRLGWLFTASLVSLCLSYIGQALLPEGLLCGVRDDFDQLKLSDSASLVQARLLLLPVAGKVGVVLDQDLGCLHLAVGAGQVQWGQKLLVFRLKKANFSITFSFSSY